MTRLIIGLMSGTSVDGIDAAVVAISGPRRRAPLYQARVVHHTEQAWPGSLRARLLSAMAPAATRTEEICRLNFLVAEQFAKAVQKVLAESHVSASQITAVASHGQTVCHLPPQGVKRSRGGKGKGRFSLPGGSAGGSGPASTLQLGDTAVLAALTGILTVGNFRTADMALGGQGAPLVPFADWVLLAHASRSRCIQNIGGIANVTYLPRQVSGVGGGVSGRAGAGTGHGKPATGDACVVAFDTGPGNMLLDAAVTLGTRGGQSYDRDGRLGAKGAIDRGLLAELQGHPYFRRRPPKSTGREIFGMQLAKELVGSGRWELETLLATLTALTAWSIVDAYGRFLPGSPDEVILCGGGADNPTLVRMVGEELARRFGDPPLLSRIDAYGIPNKAKEAASFALLGAAALDGIPASLGSVTGAMRPAVLGVVADTG